MNESREVETITTIIDDASDSRTQRVVAVMTRLIELVGDDGLDRCVDWGVEVRPGSFGDIVGLLRQTTLER